MDTTQDYVWGRGRHDTRVPTRNRPLLKSRLFQRTLAFLLFFNVCCQPAFGSGPDDFGYYGNKNEGWFFYNDPKPPPPPKPLPLPPDEKAEAPSPTPEAPSGPKPFSVAWLREKMPILLDQSIDNPTQENVQAYMYAQRLMLDMTDGFKNEGQKVVASDPYLDEQFRVPSATFAKRDELFAMSKAKKLIVSDLSQKAGLWFFFDSSCLYCQAQQDTLQRVGKDTGFVIKNISLDGKPLPGMTDFVVDKDRKMFIKFGLLVAPAVVLAYPPDKFLVVAHGAMAEDDLLDKIVVAATDQHLVSKELTDMTNLEERGIVTPADIAAMRQSDQDTNDPKVLVKMMQDAIRGRLQ